MTLLLVFLACAFTLFTLYKAIAPFLESSSGQLRFEILDEDLREIEQLVARKAALLQALRDIEYDWETSKVSEEDYKRFKASCERQAVAVMRRIDAIHGGREWDQVIDDELARRLGADAAPVEADTETPSPDAALEAAKQPSNVASPTIACPSCSEPLAPSARFCSQCGHRLSQPEGPRNEGLSAVQVANSEIDSPGSDDQAVDHELSRRALRSEVTG